MPIVALIAIALSKTDARRGRYARLGLALLVFLAYFIALTQSRSFVESGGGWWALAGEPPNIRGTRACATAMGHHQ